MLRLLFPHRKKVSQNSQGLTVIELMIVIIITGILVAIALPTFLNQVDKSRYAKARLQMRCMLQELKVYRLNNGSYPPDVNRNTPYYSGSECFKVHTGYVRDRPDLNQNNNTDIPFNSVYDYERWNYGSGCYIAVTFFGRNGLRRFTQSAINEISTTGFHFYDETDDDLVLVVDITDTPCN
ncbi:MAG: type II secretion system protein [Synechococcus sp.]|nr:type II secretion system protein [Synechococcus sp.]